MQLPTHGFILDVIYYNVVFNFVLIQQHDDRLNRISNKIRYNTIHVLYHVFFFFIISNIVFSRIIFSQHRNDNEHP